MPEFEFQPTGNEDAAFKVWVSAPSQNPTHLGRRGARLKLGKKVCKTAVFSHFGDQGTGEVKRRELRLCAYERQPDGTFAFDSPDVNWYIVDEEIEQLLAFLNSDVDQPGRYRVIDAGSPVATLLEVLDGRPDDETHQVLTALLGAADPRLLADVLAQSTSGLTGAEMAVIAGRRALLQQAADLAADPATTETDMQHLIGTAWWVFGGRYVGVLKRRDLAHSRPARHPAHQRRRVAPHRRAQEPEHPGCREEAPQPLDRRKRRSRGDDAGRQLPPHGR